MKKLQPISIGILNRIQISVNKNCIGQIIQIGVDSSNHCKIRTSQTRCPRKAILVRARNIACFKRRTRPTHGYYASVGTGSIYRYVGQYRNLSGKIQTGFIRKRTGSPLWQGKNNADTITVLDTSFFQP